MHRRWKRVCRDLCCPYTKPVLRASPNSVHRRLMRIYKRFLMARPRTCWRKTGASTEGSGAREWTGSAHHCKICGTSAGEALVIALVCMTKAKRWYSTRGRLLQVCCVTWFKDAEMPDQVSSDLRAARNGAGKGWHGLSSFLFSWWDALQGRQENFNHDNKKIERWEGSRGADKEQKWC